uniref:Uncharacterized protein n=1 Tax=Timema cristinae TaxID=61476 RepID=A0A7R9CRS6_TIMCR|nr:unnamed protein product [Timema cristinae]
MLLKQNVAEKKGKLASKQRTAGSKRQGVCHILAVVRMFKASAHTHTHTHKSLIQATRTSPTHKQRHTSQSGTSNAVRDSLALALALAVTS